MIWKFLVSQIDSKLLVHLLSLLVLMLNAEECNNIENYVNEKNEKKSSGRENQTRDNSSKKLKWGIERLHRSSSSPNVSTKL